MLEFSRAVNECLIVGDDTIIRVIEIQPAFVRLEILQTRHPETRRVETLWLNPEDDSANESSTEDVPFGDSIANETFFSQPHLNAGSNHFSSTTDEEELDDGFLDFSDLVNWKPQEGGEEDDSRFDLETDLLPLR